MNERDYLKDINEIKEILNRSSRFISLSGLSGIMAGVYAIIGALIAYFVYLPKDGSKIIMSSWNFKMLIVLLISVAILSIITAYIFTSKKAKKNNEKIWDETTKQLIINFLVPLVTGGIFIIIKLSSQQYGLSASLMLIFYGLALVNASKFTLGNIKYLGYAEIVSGLVCALLPGFGFWFWLIGFGFFHIIYGILMYLKE